MLGFVWRRVKNFAQVGQGTKDKQQAGLIFLGGLTYSSCMFWFLDQTFERMVNMFIYGFNSVKDVMRWVVKPRLDLS